MNILNHADQIREAANGVAQACQCDVIVICAGDDWAFHQMAEVSYTASARSHMEMAAYMRARAADLETRAAEMQNAPAA